MKICILTPRFPFPENGGDVLRINNIARYLKRWGHHLVLVSFDNGSSDIETAKKLYDTIYTTRRSSLTSAFYSLAFLLLGKPIQCGYYFSPSFSSLFRKVINKERPDRYIAHLVRMVPYLQSAGVEALSTVEMTDDLVKTYNLAANAKGGWLKRMIYGVEKHTIARYEIAVVKKFPKVVLVSNEDVTSLQAQVPSSKSLCLHTNGIDCVNMVRKDYNKNKICFVGNMRTLQNQDAVLHFLQEIFPIILSANPQAQFHIVGAEPPRSILSLAEKYKNVVVTGFVDDLTEYISDACMAVAPIRVAAGIQNKVLVAMATGIPVVLTSCISKAIPELVNGKNCMIEQNPAKFASCCLSLMERPETRNSIAKEGYAMVENCYSWDEKLKGY